MMRNPLHRSNRGQTLIIVALLLPILVLVLAIVVDAVNLSIQRQRIEGEAQLAADAGATIASEDVPAILIVRHWCQASISFAIWDTPACTSFDQNASDSNIRTLNQDCPWILLGQEFVSAAVSDSNILAECIGVKRFTEVRWSQAITTNLRANGISSSGAAASSGFACNGLPGCATDSGSSGCSSPQVICIEVQVLEYVGAPVVGMLTADSTTIQIQATADSSVSLPGSCDQLKQQILGASENCSVR